MKKQLRLVYGRMCFIFLLILCGSNFSKAQIVYRDLVPDASFSLVNGTTSSSLIPVDVNNDGTNDFNFQYAATSSADYSVSITALNNNSVLMNTIQNSNGINYIESLSSGQLISSSAGTGQQWSTTEIPLLSSNEWQNFATGKDRFIGVRLQSGSDWLYGWIRVNLSINYPMTVTVKDVGYESNSANTSIYANQNIESSASYISSGATLEFADADPSLNLFACGDSKSANLTIKLEQGVSSLSGKIKIKIADLNNGLYIANGSVSNSAAVSFDNSSSTDKELVLVLTNLSADAEITIPVYRTYCDIFAENQTVKTITSVFAVDDLAITQNLNLNVYLGSSLLLLSPPSPADPTSSIQSAGSDPANNNLVTFQYAIQNSPTRDFNGWILFEESQSDLGIAFDIRDIKYYLYNPSSGSETLVQTLTNPVTNNAGVANDNFFISTDNTNLSSKVVYVSIPAGYRLIIKEEIRVNGCLTAPGNQSNPHISWGCGDFDRLHALENCVENNINTVIQDNLLAAFSFMPDESNYYHTYVCAQDENGDNYRETKYVTYKNTGNGIAYDVKLKLANDNWTAFLIERDPSKIFLKITKNGITQTVTPNFTNYDLDPVIDPATGGYKQYYTASDLPTPTSLLIPDSYLQDINNNTAHNLAYNGYNFDINACFKFGYFGGDNNADPTLFSYNTLGCAAPDPASLKQIRFVTRLIIDEYIDPITGEMQKISLNPGDEVTFGWEQYKCCNSASNAPNQYVNLTGPQVWIKFNTGCIDPIDYAQLGYVSPASYTSNIFSSPMHIESYNPTSVGDKDWCPVTQDGYVERITSKFDALYLFLNAGQGDAPKDANGNSLNTNADYQNWDGDLVFRVFLEQGIDLDKALSGAITSGFVSVNGYNNVSETITSVTNNDTGCDKTNNCIGCSTTNTIPSPTGSTLTPNYYIAIRKGNTLISPVSVQLIDHNTDFNPSVKLDNFRFVTDKDGEQYASNLYEVRFKLTDLLAHADPGAVDQVNGLNDFMINAFLDLDVRAYCAANSFPCFKIVSFLDKCTSGSTTETTITRACDLAKNGYTAMHPLGQVSGKFLVNCPGCLIPGANINGASIYRETMGLPDVQDDGVADSNVPLPQNGPNASMISNGDNFFIDMNIAMSDGEPYGSKLDVNGNPSSVMKAELDAAPYYLDNLYVKIDLPHGAQTVQDNTIKPIEAEASLDGSTWIPMTVYNNMTSGYIMLRSYSQDFSSTKLSFAASENIMVRFKGLMGYIQDNTDALTLNYKAGFSPCDNCNDFNSMIVVNGTLGGMSLSDLTSHDNTFFLCTTFSNNFKYIPHVRQVTISDGGDQVWNIVPCKKDARVELTQSYDGGSNVYPNEVRNSPDTRIVEFPIPAGYEVSDLFLANTEYATADQKNQYLGSGQQSHANRFYQQFTLNKNDFHNYSTIIQIVVTSNTDFPNKLILTIQGSAIIDLSNPDYDHPETYREQDHIYDNQWISATTPLIELDESYYRRIEIYLAPIANTCVNSGDIIYSDDKPSSVIKSNLGTNYTLWTYDTESFRRLYLEPMPLTADLELHGYGATSGGAQNHTVMEFVTPKANMSMVAAETPSYTINNSSVIQIPVLVKLDYVDGTNRYSAQYPYLHIKGDAVSKGLQLQGVYLGRNQTLPANWLAATVPLTKYVDGDAIVDEYIYPLDQYSPENLPGALGDREPTIQSAETYFTMVFSYNCTSCNDLVASSCQDASDGCLTGENLQVAYGYNCVHTPTFADLAASNVCKYYDPIDFSIKNQKVYIQATNYINDTEILSGLQASILPCTTMTYKVKINSCQNGGFNSVDVGLDLPQGYSVSSYSNGGSGVAVSYVSETGKYHLDFDPAICCNASQDILFQIQTPCRIGATDAITSNVSAVTYCQQVVTLPPTVTLLKLDNFTNLSSSGIPFDNITIANPASDISVSGQLLTINYTVAAANGASSTLNSNTLSVKLNGTLYTTISIPANTVNGIYPAQLALPNACADYVVTVTPTLGYVPPCGISNGVTDPLCVKSIENTASAATNTVHVTSNVFVSVATNTGQAAFICGPGSPVTFVANVYPAGGNYSYSWSGPGIVGSSTGSTISVNAEGTYTATVTDNTCHITATGSADAIGHIEVQCPGSICPGEIPDIKVLNAGNVGGTYKAQWYDPNGSDTNDPADLAADILMDHGIMVSGYYYAAAITPACTLRTNMNNPQKCPITVNRAPQPYHITTNKPSGDAAVVFLCDGQQVTFSVTDKTINSAHPTDVIWTSGETTLDDVVAPESWAAPGASLLTAEELERGSYFIVAIDHETQCRTESNEIWIETPLIEIKRTCESGSQIKLTAVSNFQVAATDYDWKLNGDPLAQGTDHVIATQQGAYSVTEHSTGCTLYNRCWGIQENLNTTAVPNQEQLSIQDGGFEGITDCNVARGFDSDYDCLDRSGYGGPDPLPLDYTINHFMINQPGLQASDWSPNTPSTWVSSNTVFSGDGAMFIDGQPEPTAKLVWGKTVPVTHGFNYLYRFKVRDINIASVFPVEEIPELYVQQTYIDNLGNGTRYRTSKQALFNNGTTPWIEFSSYTPAIPYTIPGCDDPTTIVSVRLELFMDGGGAIGRDLAVDDVSLIPVGVCDDVIQLNLPCNTALADLQNNHQAVCPGSAATFDVINAPAGLTFKWQKEVDGTLTDVGTGASYTTPTLTLTDPNRPEFYEYQVTVTDPVNNCTTQLTAEAIVATLPQLSITSAPTATNCEKKFTAVFNGLGTPSEYDWYMNGTLVTGITGDSYTVSNLQNGDYVQCKVSNVWCSGGNDVESNIINISGVSVITANAGTDVTVCKNTPVTLGTAATTGLSYSWSPATYLDDATKAMPVYTPTGTETSMTYTLIVTDATTGCNQMDQVIVTVNPLPTTDAGADASVCKNSSVTIGTTAQSGLTYSWLPSTYLDDATIAIPTCTPIGTESSITYMVTATDATTSCSKTDQVVITVRPLPAADAGADVSVCKNSSVTIGTMAQTGLTYSWSPSTYLDDATKAMPVCTPTGTETSITYMLTVTDATTSCSQTDQVVVTIKALPANQMLNTSITTCSSYGAVLEFTSGPASAYIVTPYPTGIHSVYPYSASIGGYQYAYIGFDPVSVNTDYSITGVTYANGCSTIVSIPITVKPVPTITSTTGGAHCGTGAITLGATASDGTLNWYSASTGGSSLGTGTSYTTPSISATTTYYVASISSSNGCPSIRTAVVATIGTTTPTITGSTPGSVCGSGTVTLGATASSGATINWYSASTGGTLLGTGTSFTTPGILTTTTYYAEAYLNGCVSTRTAVVATIKAYPASQMVTTSLISCASDGATLTFTTSPASAYIVTPYPTGIHSVYPGGGGNGGDQFAYIGFDPVSSPAYYVVTGVTYADGCSTIVSIPVTVNPSPTITSTIPGAHCHPGMVTLSATASSGTIKWYSASSGGTALVTGSSSYTTPSISTTTTYYVSTTLGMCTSPRTPVIAGIGTTPTITSSPTVYRCGSGPVTLSVTTASGAIVNWYASPSGGTSLGSGTSFTTNVSSTTTYYAEGVLYGCTTRAAVVAIVNNCREGAAASDLPMTEPIDITEILPNPSETNFNLTTYSRESKTVKIFVYDVNGQLVQEGTVATNESYIFGDSFGAGVYMVKVINSENIRTFKVVKIK